MAWFVLDVESGRLLSKIVDADNPLRSYYKQNNNLLAFEVPSEIAKYHRCVLVPQSFQMLHDAHKAFYEYFQYTKKADLLNYQFVLINSNNETVAAIDLRKEFTYYSKK